MNSRERAARNAQPSFNANGTANIVLSDVFEKKKRDKQYEAAIKKILNRARKSDW